MYGRILVPVDGSPTSLKGLDEAIKLAKATGARLKLIHVVNELIPDSSQAPGLYYEQVILNLREVGKNVLADAEEAARRQAMTVETELLECIGGRAADAIIDVAKRWPADLIVLGTHGRHGLRRLAMGSDAELVVRHAPVPVLTVRQPAA
jgi:nucleotide-binding universal stress UspA family protein